MAYYSITAPVMGVVMTMFVKDGTCIVKNQRIVGLEIMKMLTEISSPYAGKLEFCCCLGQVVNQGDLLAKVHQT